MAALSWILSFIGCYLGYLFIRDIVVVLSQKSSSKKKKNALIAAGAMITLILGSVALVNTFIAEPNLDAFEDRVKFYERYKHHTKLINAYAAEVSFDSDDSLHLAYVNTIRTFIKDSRSDQGFSVNGIARSPVSQNLRKFYIAMADSGDAKQADRARLFLTIHYINTEQSRPALRTLKELSDSTHRFYPYCMGSAYALSKRINNTETAITYLNQSIRQGVLISESYQKLSFIHYFFRQNEELKKLIDNPDSKDHVPVYAKRKAYLHFTTFFDYWSIVLRNNFKRFNTWGVLSSLLILLLWLFYLRQIDFYEPERWSHITFVLFMSMCTLFLVYPLGDIIWHRFEYFTPSDDLGGIIHIIITIGMVEEFVKIIPVLILLRFTTAINEPIDYIIYPSIAALGFAFIENIGYIQESSLQNINARSLLATVAHMIFSSTIGYGLMLARYRYKTNAVLLFLLAFIVAATMHGFYDFWVIHETAVGMGWMTLLFFISSVHLWIIYANNATNISTFYDPNRKLVNDNVKYFLLIGLLGIFMLSYVATAWEQGRSYANFFLRHELPFFGYFMLYLALSLSRFSQLRGYLTPLAIPFNFLIPHAGPEPDISGLKLSVYGARKAKMSKRFEHLLFNKHTPAVLVKRLILDGNPNAYLVKLSYPVSTVKYMNQHVVLLTKDLGESLADEGQVLSYLFLIPDSSIIDRDILQRSELQFTGWVYTIKNTEM